MEMVKLMKILVLANKDTGLYSFRFELLRKMKELNYEVYISCPNGERIKEFEKIGCKFIETDISRRGINPFVDLKLCLKYFKIIKKIRPDVILTYTIKPNIYGGVVASLCDVPYLTNITGLGTVFERTSFINKLVRFMYKFALRKSRCVFFQNKSNMNTLKEGNIISSKSVLLPGSGVNLEKFSVIDYPDDETTEFVFVARIMKEKGIEEYFDAVRYIKNKYPKTRFHICGGCEEAYSEKLKEMQDNDLIVYHGQVLDVREVLAKVHCLVNPSYHEGMSNVLQEAAACARPGLCSDIPGCKEIVDDGKSGFLFEAKSSQSLIEALEKFMNLTYDERKIMGTNARRKVEKKFDRNIVIDAYLKEIEDLKIKQKRDEI